MSDKYGNHVDGEVWVPLRANDWIDRVEIGSVKDGSQKPEVTYQYVLAYPNGKVDEKVWSALDSAKRDLLDTRTALASLGVPEEFWPILMQREVTRTLGSWQHMNV